VAIRARHAIECMLSFPRLRVLKLRFCVARLSESSRVVPFTPDSESQATSLTEFADGFG